MRSSGRLLSIIVGQLIFALNFASAQNGSSDWPSWGGPNGDFTVNDAGILKPNQTYELEVRWRKPLGSGYSAVSVREGHAVTMFSDSTFDYVVALDPSDGGELWRFKIDSTFLGRYGSDNGPISTPLLTPDKVIALTAAGLLVGLELQTGEPVWTIDLVREHQALQPFYGIATSPLLYENVVIVETGGTRNNTISAFDPNTGQVLWSTGSDTVGYQSPRLLKTQNDAQIVVVTKNAVHGLQPETGNLLWRFPHGARGTSMGAGSANIVPVGDNRFFLKKLRGGALVELRYTNESYAAEVVWNSREIARSYVVPVYYNGHLFGYKSRILTSVNTETGQRAWRSRAPGDGFPIVVDGYLTVMTKDGRLSIAPASSEGYHEVAKLDLFSGGRVWTPVSVADGSFFARSMTEVARVDVVPSSARLAGDRVTAGLVAGSEFARFVETVAKSENKKALVDAFMAEQTEFPVVEGDSLVHFIYRGEAEDVALTGDLVGRRYDLPMHRIAGTDLFYYSSPLETDARLTYGFTRDLQVAMIDSLNPRSVRHTRFGQTSWFNMPGWQMPDYLTKRPVAAGRIDSLDFESTITGIKRKIEVYLPVGYDRSNDTYPVAFVHDGRGARRNGEMTQALDNLIGKSVQPVIVVFMPRFFRGGYREYIGEQADSYTRMLVEEVVPLVDRTYRTQPTAEKRANIGYSLAAFMAFHATFKHPEAFARLSIQSIYWDEKGGRQQEPLIAAGDPSKLKIHMNWGTYDDRSPLELSNGPDRSRDLARLLKHNGYTLDGGELHDGSYWPSWKYRTHLIFETLFPLSGADR